MYCTVIMLGYFTLLMYTIWALISKSYQSQLLEYCLQKLGLSELLRGSELHQSLRGPLCAIILMSYHTVVTYVLGQCI